MSYRFYKLTAAIRDERDHAAEAEDLRLYGRCIAQISDGPDGLVVRTVRVADTFTTLPRPDPASDGNG